MEPFFVIRREGASGHVYASGPYNKSEAELLQTNNPEIIEAKTDVEALKKAGGCPKCERWNKECEA